MSFQIMDKFDSMCKELLYNDIPEVQFCCGSLIGEIKPPCAIDSWKERRTVGWPNMLPYDGNILPISRGREYCDASCPLLAYRCPDVCWMTTSLDGDPCTPKRYIF